MLDNNELSYSIFTHIRMNQKTIDRGYCLDCDKLMALANVSFKESHSHLLRKLRLWLTLITAVLFGKIELFISST